MSPRCVSEGCGESYWLVQNPHLAFVCDVANSIHGALPDDSAQLLEILSQDDSVSRIGGLSLLVLVIYDFEMSAFMCAQLRISHLQYCLLKL